MSLSPAEEALVRDLIAQNAALLSLASSESTIISKLGATKTTLSALTAASSLADSDLMLVRQGVTDKSVTGALLKAFAVSPAASETVAGVLEIATAAEAQAFTANKAIDGAKLSSAFQGSNQSKAANGYQKLPGGVIVQWGGTRPGDISGTDSGNITFPIAFPTACRRVIIGSYGEPPNVGQGLCALYGAPTTTSFGYTRTEINGNATPGAGFDWVAFGE